MAKKQGVRNFVHKYSIELNRATVEVDRKKALKRGYCKHKGGKQAPFDFLAVAKSPKLLRVFPRSTLN